MPELSNERSQVVLVGANAGGCAMLDLLLDEPLVKVVAVVDRDAAAPGMLRAQAHHIAVYTDIATALQKYEDCIVFNLTGNDAAVEQASTMLGRGSVIGGSEAKLIWRMIMSLKRTRDELSYQANHDALTELHNRRYMLQRMRFVLEQSLRYGHDCALALIDIDLFKRVNDTYGHDVGDVVIKHVTEVLRQGVRSADDVARWGGEEFLVLMPNCDANAGVEAGEKWLNRLRGAPVQVKIETQLSPTFSAGVAAFSQLEQPGSVDEVIDILLAKADRALYCAKEQGRNRVLSDG
ncbi:MAG: GGDEF domain-containing protein [Mariprofundales bacterium]